VPRSTAASAIRLQRHLHSEAIRIKEFFRGSLRNTYRLFESRKGGFFLRKKPLERVLSVYTNSENAIAFDFFGSNLLFTEE
jgi:hypothetical protein